MFPITRSGRVEKSQKKKIFLKDVFPCGFLFPVIKRGKKVSGFVFFRKWRGKCEIDYKKKENFFFSPFIELFN